MADFLDGISTSYGLFKTEIEFICKSFCTVDLFNEGDLSFMCVLSIKVPTRKKSGNLFNDHHIYKVS